MFWGFVKTGQCVSHTRASVCLDKSILSVRMYSHVVTMCLEASSMRSWADRRRFTTRHGWEARVREPQSACESLRTRREGGRSHGHSHSHSHGRPQPQPGPRHNHHLRMAGPRSSSLQTHGELAHCKPRLSKADAWLELREGGLFRMTVYTLSIYRYMPSRRAEIARLRKTLECFSHANSGVISIMILKKYRLPWRSRFPLNSCRYSTDLG